MDFSKFMYIALFLFAIVASVSSAPKNAHRTKSDEVRNKREQHGNRGITGPVFSFVKTDKNAHFKWGVRHHLGRQNAGHN